MSKVFKDEAELATHVIEWLRSNGWAVHQEVMLSYSGRTADVIAEKDGKLWIVECKNTFSDSVLEQCYMHMPYCHYVSAAVPGYDRTVYRRSSSQGRASMVKKHFLKYNGIGLIRVNKISKGAHVDEELSPEYQRLFKKLDPAKRFINRIKRIKEKFHILHKNATAGGQGGQVTDYTITMYKVRKYLKENGPTDPLTVAKNIEHHYSSNSSCKQGILKGISYGWVPGIAKNIEDKKAILYLIEGYDLDGSLIDNEESRIL